MDLHLHNARTGETFKLAPDGTLIGSAEHAAVAAEGGPYLAALAVRYPSGWALFGLSNELGVTFNRQPLGPAQRVTPRKGDLLTVGDERFTFVSPQARPEDEETPAAEPPTPCLLYVLYPDGKEECRAADHDLLFGRLEYCHVQFADTRLSRLNAMLTCDGGAWYIHNLTKKVIGRNKKPVRSSALVAEGDELLIGPLVVRVELHGAGEELATEESGSSARRSAFADDAGAFASTDASEDTADGTGEKPAAPNLEALRESASGLDQWLQSHPPRPQEAKGGIGGWLEAQRDRLKRFWFDTPETTSARSLRASGRFEEAFNVLDRAIRARPESPDLLRELYRLYDALGLHDLCYRPLRQIEKLAESRGAPDPWVLETLARLCERLSHDNPSMTERAVKYWTKLEQATGTSHNREKANVLARRALRDGGYTGTGEF
jgi:hypothetical protein